MQNSFYRGRRLRSTPAMRAFTQEVTVHAQDLIQPIFVTEGKNKDIPIPSMEGISRFSVDRLTKEVDDIREAGVPSVLIFGVPDEKDSKASAAWKENNVVTQAVEKIKAHDPEMLVITDVCLCAYTDHGHCGHLNEKGQVENDSSLETLSKMAVAHASCGADIVAPSDMMDGRVLAIRQTLDSKGFKETPILSYAAKYASAFYGPFRDAADSGAKKGDRKSYQMAPPNLRQAMREIEADIKEGADMVIIKPALAYLDVVNEARRRFDVPIVAYNVSGEYAMVKAAAKQGWLDEKEAWHEIFWSMKRAGADRIISYGAKQFRKI